MAGTEDGLIPTLQEETREAQGRALELLLGAVVISTLLSLAINLGTTLLLTFLNTTESLVVTILSALVAISAVVALLPRITTSIKEFHEEVEILLPLLVSPQDAEVLRLAYYDDLTELAHAALARRPAEERKQLAQMLLSPHDELHLEERRKITASVLELAQFLFVTEVVRGSRRFLGAESAYHKGRQVARLQAGITSSLWSDLVALAPGNRYIPARTAGVPEKVLLPTGAHVRLPDVPTHVFGKVQKQDPNAPGLEYVSLVEIDAKRDRVLHISALAGFSAHALPNVTQPKRGFTARCVLRNARDSRLRGLAVAEEETAEQMAAAEHRPAVEREEPTARHYVAFKRMYEGGQKPYLMRIFVRFDGTFNIRLLSSERRQRGLYAWATALSRHLARTDVEVFLAILKDNGQKTPRRTF
ncbi:MAG TPA: hypothetical protein VGP82_24750 [Ktedonobacterales bacterium]|nr:hypothetical protein [Ktedonobacterales bacterium]